MKTVHCEETGVDIAYPMSNGTKALVVIAALFFLVGAILNALLMASSRRMPIFVGTSAVLGFTVLFQVISFGVVASYIHAVHEEDDWECEKTPSVGKTIDALALMTIFGLCTCILELTFLFILRKRFLSSSFSSMPRQVAVDDYIDFTAKAGPGVA